MELHELPDLSDWRFVEIWNVEEAALIWAAVDPAMHPDTRLEQLKDVLPLPQYKKAWVSRKAFSEAICHGTLPFVEAWEARSGGWNEEEWYKEIEFPELPSARLLVPHMTRVSQAALLKWAKNKLPSYRANLQRLQPGRQQNLQDAQASAKPLTLPNYTTPALELLAVHIEENLAGVPDDQRPTPGQQKEWLKQQAIAKGLGRREHEAIYYVARPPEIKQRATGGGVQPESEAE